MHLIVGLGNPGSRYARNRHNIGFMAADAVARGLRASPWRNRFRGLVCEAAIGGDKILILKPETFMNESGRSVSEAMRFFKLSLDDIIVFYDELDLAPSKMRVKIGGGNSGHKGLNSISACCGNDYKRVRLGIGHPGNKILVQPHVLGDFAKSEESWVQDLTDACAANISLLLEGQDSSFSNKVHLTMEAKGWTDVKLPGGRSGIRDKE